MSLLSALQLCAVGKKYHWRLEIKYCFVCWFFDMELTRSDPAIFTEIARFPHKKLLPQRSG